MLRQLSSDVNETKEANKKALEAVEKVTKLETEVVVLKSENDKLHKIVDYHQRFLETLDAREREKNIIIMGLSEASDLGDGDEQRVARVLETIDVPVEINAMTIRRIGRQDERQKRPILVSFQDKETRQNVLDKAKTLKEADAPFQSIYIKKDMHPSVRKELDRLRKVEKKEKAKPENQGKAIRYDRKQRVITCDDVVIDRFSASSFF